VLLGPQGAGKGTQCARLAAALGLLHLSTGDLLREAVRDRTPLGRAVQGRLARGELVPDELMVAVVLERLDSLPASTKGYLLDGFPRTVAQADALVAAEGPVDAAVALEVPDEVVLDRLTARRVCPECGWVTTTDSAIAIVACRHCGGTAVRRADDTDDAIRRRLALYESQTRPLVDWFDHRGLLVTVDGVGDPDAVFERILGALLPQLERAS
jgi:adenylate kinase